MESRASQAACAWAVCMQGRALQGSFGQCPRDRDRHRKHPRDGAADAAADGQTATARRASVGRLQEGPEVHRGAGMACTTVRPWYSRSQKCGGFQGSSWEAASQQLRYLPSQGKVPCLEVPHVRSHVPHSGRASGTVTSHPSIRGCGCGARGPPRPVACSGRLVLHKCHRRTAFPGASVVDARSGLD